MQHHTHAHRAAPILRGHPIPMHLNATGGQAALAAQQQSTHMATISLVSAPPPTAAAATTNATAKMPHTTAATPLLPPPPQHIRDHHHNRYSHPQPPQSMHTAAHMQKIRQQHQHIGNNSNLGKNGHQSYNNHTNAPHQDHKQHHQQQQQQQQPHHPTRNMQQQQQHHGTHLTQSKSHNHAHNQYAAMSASNTANNNNLLSQQHVVALQHTTHLQQQPHPYYNNHKHKYNNNGAKLNFIAGGHPLKGQLPNNASRQAKNVRSHNEVAAAAVASESSCSGAANSQGTTTPSGPTISSTAAASVPGMAITNQNGLTETQPPQQQQVVSSATDVSRNSATLTPSTSTEAISTVCEAITSSNAAQQTADVTNNAEEAHQLEADKENVYDITSITSVGGELLPVTSNNSSGCGSGSGSSLLPNVDPSAAKSKEKTPMCLVNELARFNKITHQYRLTSEKGPAHCKRFFVTLKLGDEEYSAEGFKIKKAQHLAAAEAIEKTKYKHPLPKLTRRSDESMGSPRTNITPTVELNALAMKLGQQTCYFVDTQHVPPPDAVTSTGDRLLNPYGGPPPQHMLLPPQHHPSSYMRRHAFAPPPPPPLMHHQHQRFSNRPGFQPKYRYATSPTHSTTHNNMQPQHHHPFVPYQSISNSCRVTLVVGKQKFTGYGRTLQQAKHDAAGRALQTLREQATHQLNEELNSSLEDTDGKSPISLVHEIGIKRSMTVHFKVLREEGPAHMRNFITACIFGNIVTEGEGNGKKLSKKRAAEKMLEELKKLPPLTPTKSPMKRIKVKMPGKPGLQSLPSTNSNGKNAGKPLARKRPPASIKEKPVIDVDHDNPITRLIQMQQTRKEKEPVFELVAKNGNDGTRKREFIIEVSVQGIVARGMGSSKKVAKRNAAQNLLNIMGVDCDTGSDIPKPVSVSVDQTSGHVIVKTENNNSALVADANCSTKTRDTTVSSGAVDVNKVASTVTSNLLDGPMVSTSAGPVPGVLILRQNKKNSSKKKDISNSTAETNKSQLAVDAANKESASATKATANENGTSATVTVVNANSGANKGAGVKLKDQLMYLAKVLGFEVSLSDYPKGNHEEFLTIVTLSTIPPQICHGTGSSTEESQDDAAKNALKILSQLGLNKAKE